MPRTRGPKHSGDILADDLRTLINNAEAHDGTVPVAAMREALERHDKRTAERQAQVLAHPESATRGEWLKARAAQVQ